MVRDSGRRQKLECGSERGNNDAALFQSAGLHVTVCITSFGLGGKRFACA